MKGKRVAPTSGKDKDATKKRKRERHFLQGYTAAYPCIIQSKVSTTYARCTVCNFDFVISHGGKDDVDRHVASARHKKKAEAAEKSTKMTKDLWAAKR